MKKLTAFMMPQGDGEVISYAVAVRGIDWGHDRGRSAPVKAVPLRSFVAAKLSESPWLGRRGRIR